MQDKEAKALKEDYAKARQAAQEKAAAFDKVREAARALNKELEEKNKQLKDQEALVARLGVNPFTPPLLQNPQARGKPLYTAPPSESAPGLFWWHLVLVCLTL